MQESMKIDFSKLSSKDNASPSLKAVDSLRAIEWHGVNTEKCSVCGGFSPIQPQVDLEDEDTGHWPGCHLANAIKVLGGHVKMRGEKSFLSAIKSTVNDAMNDRLTSHK